MGSFFSEEKQKIKFFWYKTK